MSVGDWGLAAAVLLGVLGSLTPCGLPSLLLVDRLSRRRTAALLFVAGNACGLLSLGVLLVLAGTRVSARAVTRTGALVTLAAGGWLLAGGATPLVALGRRRVHLTRGGMAFVLGVPLALVGDGCSLPVLIALAACSAAGRGPWLLLGYVAGRCLPLLGWARTGGVLPRLQWAHRLSGAVLVTTGLWLWWTGH